MEIFALLLNTLTTTLFIYLGVSGLYMLVFALAGSLRKASPEVAGAAHKIAVLIPGYKEDEVIVDVAEHALTQHYPQDRYEVFVIADSFQAHTLDALELLPIEVIEVAFEQSTKSKALNKAMEQIGDDFDLAVVLDADNLMAPDFLSRISAAHHQGFQVIQGRRVAKNSNTTFAILDGISEAVNNHIFRQGHRALGLSSGIIGSGMAFEYGLFKDLMRSIQAVGGFDKELEFRLFEQGITIDYLDQALVYDEKIQQAGDFQNQRRRWLSTNGVYLKKFYRTALQQLWQHGNVDMADKLFQMALPPRVLWLGGVCLMTLFAAVLTLAGIPTLVPFSAWIALLAMTVLTFVLATPRGYYNRQTLKAALSVPKAFVLMFGLLFKLKGANKTFIHTKHSAANH